MTNQNLTLADTSLCPRRVTGTILIVDDDSFFRGIIVKLLSSRGHNVIEARNAQEAEQAVRLKPDLAIIDYRLPNVDGTIVIESIRSRGYKFPIVFCSGSTYSHKTLSNVRNLLDVNLMVRKPINPPEFLAQVETLLLQSMPEEVPAPIEFSPEAEQECKIHYIEQPRQPLPALPDFRGAAIEEYQSAPTTEYLADAAAQETVTAYGDCAPDADCPNGGTGADIITNDNIGADGGAKSSYDDQTTGLLDELRITYLEELPGQVSELLAQLSAGIEKHDDQLLQSASNEAHKIRGTAGAFGLDAMSYVAGVLEERIDSMTASGCCDFHLTAAEMTAPLLSLLEGVLPCETAPIQQPEEEYRDESCSEGRRIMRVLTVSGTQAQQISTSHLAQRGLHVDLLAVNQPLRLFGFIEEFIPDIIIIDCELSNLNGLELCKMIRTNGEWTNVKIIMVTNSVCEEKRQQIFQAGADDYLLCPIMQAEVYARLSAAADGIVLREIM